MSNSVYTLEKIRDTIALNAELQAYCQGKYAKNAKVLLGLDLENPPGENDFPIVAIHGISRRAEQNKILYDINIGVAIRNENETSGQDCITQDGITESEEVLYFVENSLIKNQASLGKVVFSGRTEQDNFYPIFVSSTVCTVENIRNSRRK